MNKKVLSIIGSLVIIIVAAITFVAVKPKSQSTPQQQQSSSQSPQSSQQTVNESGKAGTYVPYSDTAIANTAGQKALFFYAPWCPQCRSIESGMTSEELPANWTIFKVDYDSNQTLRKKYGVTLQTTFVKVDDQGELLSKYVAYDDPTFAAVKQNFLNK